MRPAVNIQFLRPCGGRTGWYPDTWLSRKTSRKQTPHEHRTFQLRRPLARADRWASCPKSKTGKDCFWESPRTGQIHTFQPCCARDGWSGVAQHGHTSAATGTISTNWRWNSLRCNSSSIRLIRKFALRAERLRKGSSDWTQIPAVPTAAFKELELSCIPPGRADGGVSFQRHHGAKAQPPFSLGGIAGGL